MAYIDWINDKDLDECVSILLNSAKTAKDNASSKFHKNVVDPFSALFEIAGFDHTYNEWIKSEIVRQAQKTLNNQVGFFHKSILGCCKDWRKTEKAEKADLICDEKKVIAKIYNKHNTLKKSDLRTLYQRLDKLISHEHGKYEGYIAYYVTIIPNSPKRFNNVFAPSAHDSENMCAQNEKIRMIDGYSFYDLVTESHGSLEKLFDVLPCVINKCQNRESEIPGIEQVKELFNIAFLNEKIKTL